MSEPNSRFVWSEAIEKELINKVLGSVVPKSELPPERELREAQSHDELQSVAENFARAASHDTFIVQAVSRAIAHLEIDTRFHLKLAEQVGDDGRHAVDSTFVASKIWGKDALPKVEEYVDEFWEALGDVPYRDIFGFLAFQFHFELHLIGRVTAQNFDRKVRFNKKGALGNEVEATHNKKELDDELIHRTYIAEWTRQKLDALPVDERDEWIAKYIEADNEVQKRLNPYHRYRVSLAEKAWLADTRHAVGIYDTFRRELLALVLNKKTDELPELTSLAA